MKDGTIISYESGPDDILIQGRYNYSIFTTLGLTLPKHYSPGLINSDQGTVIDAIRLYKQSKALRFRSALAKRESYNIMHIVISNMQAK